MRDLPTRVAWAAPIRVAGEMFAWQTKDMSDRREGDLAAEVKEIIDGRKRVAAHGSSKMPVWGTVFAEERSYEPPDAHAQSQIEIITSFLASIQH